MKNSPRTSTGHTRNARSIIRAIVEGGQPPSQATGGALPGHLSAPATRDYQRHVYDHFGDVISTPSFDYISKIPSGWLIVGDHRAELAARIALIVERHGVGVGMMVLHAKQMCARHIPIEIPLNGESQDLAQPTRRLHGTRGESVLYVPVRKYRNDFRKVADLNIVKPQRMWDESKIVSHEQITDRASTAPVPRSTRRKSSSRSTARGVGCPETAASVSHSPRSVTPSR